MLKYLVCAGAVLCAASFFAIGLAVSKATDGGYAIQPASPELHISSRDASQ
jgi:hypothetical protein